MTVNLPSLDYTMSEPYPQGADIALDPKVRYGRGAGHQRRVGTVYGVSIYPARTYEAKGPQRAYTTPSWVIASGRRINADGAEGKFGTIVRVDLTAEQPQWLADIIADASRRLGIDLTTPAAS